MKKKKSNFLCVLLSLLMCVVMIPSTVADAITVTTKSGQQIDQDGDQIKGTEDGYSYELWNQNNAGTATMTLGEGGAYSCVWSNIENVLFRRGVDFDCTKTYKELGNISIEYEAEYNNPTQNTYLCVYGWTKSPLIEYYIVDSWGSWRPPGAESKGQINVDGGTYDVYVTDRINQPSIEGNTTFKQYWSVRTSKRTSGTISVSTHFAEWEKMGMKTGKLYEAALNVEGYQSSGTANVTKNVVTVGGEIQEPDPVEPIEPDENGYYFHSTFESGTDDWDSRGGTTVETVSQNAYKGSKCLSVTGRTDSWNGTSRSLPVAAFVPGQSYSFSTMVMQNSVASEDFRLTLQYDLAGETNYSMIASASGAKGEWVQLANTSYTIPEGASNLLLYVETADSTESFFVDEAIGAVDGTVIKEETAIDKGDVNGDGEINVADITMLTNYLLAKTRTITGDADINSDGVLNVFDLAMLRRTVLNPSSDDPVTEADPAAYMESVRNSLTLDVPSSATASGTFGELKQITYYSSTAQRNKTANVLLPEGYSTNEKYPVLYVNHGIFCDENQMLGMGVPEIVGNLARSGEAEKMIVVFPQMYTSTTEATPPMGQINAEVEANYDKFREDLINDLMPYIEENYSVKTGRENTAIAGFSMGGRETLYIGVSRPDKFGYIGAACPAPGVTPATDYAGEHVGSMTEDEFKISNKAYEPYLLMITGGTNDGTVGTFPQSYHELFTKNGQDHVWLEVPGGGHDNSSVIPHMYNFIRNIFKAGKTGGSSNNEQDGVDISWIDPSKPMVAISFDDGAVGTSESASSMRILNALNKSGFHSTFFYVGNWTQGSDKEAEVKKAYSMGMEIANHTVSHPDLTQKSDSEIRSEYDGCAQTLKNIIGTDPSPLLRLPYLAVNDNVKSVLNDVPMITCSIDTQDWNGATKDQMVSKIKAAMSDGSLDGAIVLAHETYDTTAEAMEELCPYLKSQGWQIVSISEMFAVKGKTLQGGQVYTKS